MIHPRTLESLEFNKIVTALAERCSSPGGHALALRTKPFSSRQKAQSALDLYKDSCKWAQADGKNQISSFPDISGLLDSINKKMGPNGLPPAFALDLDAFWALREILRSGQQIVASIKANGGEQWLLLLEKAQACAFPAPLLAALNRCISDDGLLKDESSPELFRLRTELRKLHQSCLRKVHEYAQQYNMLPYLQDEFMTLSSDRYVLPLKANFKGRMQGIIHDWSQTGETCYFEPYFLVEINNRLQELKHQEREEERQILRYLTSLLAGDIDSVSALAGLLAELDVLQATRSLAQAVGAHPPAFCESSEGIELLEARHPLLALVRLGKDNAAPVRPVNIILRPGEKALIITGGNAGGKTVCLKCLGLLSAMAMAGLPISASESSRLPWFDRIDAFIGDEQSIADNVSTFSAQIEHLAKALPHLNNNGLALLDEFGAGTDPAEGAALAQATHDEFLEQGCFVVSATHFPALKTYALSHPGVRAATMLFDPQTNQPLYKLAYDQVGASQALAVARAYGLPQSILKRAQHYLLQDGDDSDSLLQRLNELAAQREEEIEKLRRQQASQASILKEQQEKLLRQRQSLQTDVQDNIRTLMHAWKTGKSSARQTLKSMSGLRQELGLPGLQENDSILPAPKDFKIGQKVQHAGLKKTGMITDIDTKREKARVDLNGVSIWAAYKDLRQTSTPTLSAKAQSSRLFTNNPPPMALDVHGQRAPEALLEVEKIMDRAISAGSTEIEIIHGRGTGALRREIHNFLKSFPNVASIQLAPEDRGGDGMSIIILK